MEMLSEMKWFFDASQHFGRIDLVQGTGGNISVKVGKRLFIKASGFRFDQVKENGYVELDLERLHGISDEAISSAVIGSGKPSLETGFHSFLGKYVVHLHPTLFNLILCSVDGKNISNEIFSDVDSLWVPYRKVGYDVSMEVKKRIGEMKKKPELILLQNHGIILSSNKEERPFEILRTLMPKIVNYLDARPFSYAKLEKIGNVFANKSKEALTYLKGRENSLRFLFPDAVVFTSHLFSKNFNDIIYYTDDFQKSSNIDEILMAHLYLIKHIKSFSLPNYLDAEDVEEILGLKSEKYRRKIIGLGD